MRLPDGHFIRIPHEAELKRRSSGRRTPVHGEFEIFLWCPMYLFQDISIKEDCRVGKMHTKQEDSIKEFLMMFQWIEIFQILD